MDEESKKKLQEIQENLHKEHDDEKMFPGLDSIIQVSAVDNDVVLLRLQTALTVLRANKPSDRSETARRYAVTITEMEKVVAYFKTYVVDAANNEGYLQKWNRPPEDYPDLPKE